MEKTKTVLPQEILCPSSKIFTESYFTEHSSLFTRGIITPAKKEIIGKFN